MRSIVLACVLVLCGLPVAGAGLAKYATFVEFCNSLSDPAFDPRETETTPLVRGLPSEEDIDLIGAIVHRKHYLDLLDQVVTLREYEAQLGLIELLLEDENHKGMSAIKEIREGLQQEIDRALEIARRVKLQEQDSVKQACRGVPPPEIAEKPVPAPVPATSATGAPAPAAGKVVDTTDPATLPEPAAPSGGHLVLVQTNIVPFITEPRWVVSPKPQNTTLTTPIGTGDCKWDMPPKTLGAHQKWRFDFHVTAAAPVGQRYAQNLMVVAPFLNVHGLPTEIVVSVEGGQSDSAHGSVEFDTGSIEGLPPTHLWTFRVSGCGSYIDYIYQYRS